MKLNPIKTIAVAGASALMLGHAEAQSQFTFSFTSQSVPPYYIAGTVAGIITLNASQNQATSIVVTSVPSAVSNVIGYDWVKDSGATVRVNTFAVTGGNISDVEFDSDSFGVPILGQLSLGYADLLASAGSELDNPNLFAGITFTPVVVPEPSTLALAALGAGALLKFRRRN